VGHIRPNCPKLKLLGENPKYTAQKNEKLDKGYGASHMIDILENAVGARQCQECYQDYCNSYTCDLVKAHGVDAYHFAQERKVFLTDGSWEMVEAAKNGVGHKHSQPILTKEMLIQQMEVDESSGWGEEYHGQQRENGKRSHYDHWVGENNFKTSDEFQDRGEQKYSKGALDYKEGRETAEYKMFLQENAKRAKLEERLNGGSDSGQDSEDGQSSSSNSGGGDSE